MRIFDAMNDVDNMKPAIKYTDRYGGMADCAVCYAIDPHHSALERIEAALHGRRCISRSLRMTISWKKPGKWKIIVPTLLLWKMPMA